MGLAVRQILFVSNFKSSNIFAQAPDWFHSLHTSCTVVKKEIISGNQAKSKNQRSKSAQSVIQKPQPTY